MTVAATVHAAVTRVLVLVIQDAVGSPEVMLRFFRTTLLGCQSGRRSAVARMLGQRIENQVESGLELSTESVSGLLDMLRGELHQVRVASGREAFHHRVRDGLRGHRQREA